jgi:hypothetical protein
MKYRKVGLRLTIPKGAGPFPGKGSALLFDVETGDPLNAAYAGPVVDFDAAGPISVTAKFYPEVIEVIEAP